MKKSALFIITFLVLTSSAGAQKEFYDLDQVKQAVVEKTHSGMKDFECRDIEPLSFPNAPPSNDLRIQACVSGDSNVKLVLQKYRSVEEASMRIKAFAGTRSRILNGLGEEAYLFSIRNEIVFRMSNLVVYVTAVVTKEKYTEEERKKPNTGAEEIEEGTKVSRAFAQHVAAVLKTL